MARAGAARVGIAVSFGMSGFIQAVLTVGGMSSFGRFVDALVQSEKGQTFVETWWNRFIKIKPETFAQQEADFAVRFIDKVFGSRIISWKRQRFLAIIMAFSVCVGICFALGSSAFSWQMHIAQHTREMIAEFNRWSGAFTVGSLVLALLSLSVSLSVTRWFATVTAKVPSHRPWISIAIFLAFLIFQLWVVVIGAFIASFCLGLVAHLVQLYLTHPTNEWDGYSLDTGLNFYDAAAYGIMVMLYVGLFYAPLHLLFITPFQLPFFLVMFQFPGDNLLEKSLAVSTAFLGYAGALIRLSIAAVFVVSYASVPYRHQILHWLTELSGTNKPIFAILFGLLGVLIVLAQALFSLLD